MRDPETDSHSSPPPGEGAPAITGGLRLTSQLVGLGLLLVGCYYALGIVATVIGHVRDPESLQAPAEAMAAALGVDRVSVALGESTLPVGRAAGMAFLLLWYAGAGWIVLKLVSVGGQLMLAASNERREFYAATREMMVAVRREVEETVSKG